MNKIEDAYRGSARVATEAEAFAIVSAIEAAGDKALWGDDSRGYWVKALAPQRHNDINAEARRYLEMVRR